MGVHARGVSGVMLRVGRAATAAFAASGALRRPLLCGSLGAPSGGSTSGTVHVADAGDTVTGTPDRTAVPVSGSTRASSVTAFMFGPATAPATRSVSLATA